MLAYPPNMEENSHAPQELSADSPKPKSGNPHSLGILCHLLAFSGYLIPFGNIFGPLVLWLLKRADDPFVDACGKEALNFQISMTVYAVISGLSIIIGIGFLLLPVIMILNIVYTVIASIKASEGQSYRYPLTFRLIQ